MYDSACRGLEPVVRLIKKGLFPIIQVGIPIVLIVMGTLDLGKAVLSSDEKEIKGAQGRLVKRCIYAVAIFFIVTIVTLLMNLVTGAAQPDQLTDQEANWATCWQNV